ncbi:hypothetical protein [Deinococcus ruber]|nr:hypothetical protein [Deinococcus ruber]
MPFIGQERTVSDVASMLEVSPHRMLYQVRRLVRLELLEVVREVTRAGRAVRWYRAVADGFFVPFALTDAQTPAQLAQRLLDESRQVLEKQVGRAWMTAGSDLGSWGINVYCTPEGQVNTSLVPAPTPEVPRAFFDALLESASPAVWDSAFALALDRENAKALQRELSELTERYRKREQPGPPTHLIRLAMAPLDR